MMIVMNVSVKTENHKKSLLRIFIHHPLTLRTINMQIVAVLSGLSLGNFLKTDFKTNQAFEQSRAQPVCTEKHSSQSQMRRDNELQTKSSYYIVALQKLIKI